MKRSLKMWLAAAGIALGMTACQEDDHSFGDITTPTNLELTATIQGVDGANPNGDGSGLVVFNATADDALNYRFVFSDGGDDLTSDAGAVTKRFTQTGVHTYTVTVLATGTGGATASKSMEVTVLANYSDPETVEKLTGGGTKKWYWAKEEQGHLGVGPNSDNPEQNYFGYYYMAAPNEKAGGVSGCLYGAELVFNQVGENVTFQLNNQGNTFFNKDFAALVGGTNTEDACWPHDTSALKNVSFSPAESVVAPEHSTGTSMTFSDGGFMAYYIGQSTYEILSISDTRLVVRAVQGNNNDLVWYQTFTSAPVQEPEYDNLVWSDEFDTAGAPDASKWGYDLGAGGWGNQEVQTYTNNAENVSVADGHLKITLKKNGSSYTSARLKSEGKYDFTYGKLVFRAKLPTGGGTWPALWMLGANYQTNAWPACGEIDVMEHVGNQQDIIHGTLHYPGNFGGNANTNTTTVAGVSNDFHEYSVIWSPTSIRFFVDGNQFHSFANTGSTAFNADFFIIMNVAMGGTFGGAVDPTFTESSMEVDYVRVYQ